MSRELFLLIQSFHFDVEFGGISKNLNDNLLFFLLLLFQILITNKAQLIRKDIFKDNNFFPDISQLNFNFFFKFCLQKTLNTKGGEQQLHNPSSAKDYELGHVSQIT